MIKICGVQIESGHFPDGTTNLCLQPEIYEELSACKEGVIDWRMENTEEIVLLQFIVNHLHDKGYRNLTLHMPYVPFGRQDKARREDEILLLKYFSEIINSLKFTKVTVYDPHSTVTQNLIDRLEIKTPMRLVERVYKTITHTENTAPLLFFPDEGSRKRYESISKQQYCLGSKHRDLNTADIDSYDIYGNVQAINGNPILIVDDICSAGGTFYMCATELKKLGAGNIYLWVTHCEDNIWRGQLLGSDYIKRIYTTNSLIRRPHIKIEEFEV